MKLLTYYGTFDPEPLIRQIADAFPDWIPPIYNRLAGHFYIVCEDGLLKLYVPEDADEALLLQVITLHDPTAARVRDIVSIKAARDAFMALPNWATWSAQEAADFIQGDILNGMSRAQLDAWVDANVTNINTAKTALKLVGDELVDLRQICTNMAKMLVFLREIAVRR